MQGIELVQKVLTGATPVLAPGSMALLGLIGLTHSSDTRPFTEAPARLPIKKVTHDPFHHDHRFRRGMLRGSRLHGARSSRKVRDHR